MARSATEHAKIDPRRNRGGSTTYRVRWFELDLAAVARGATARPTYTFSTRDLGEQALSWARRLQALVNANAGTTPTREQFDACGLGWKYPTAPAAAPGNPPPRHRGYVSVTEACERYIAYRRRRRTRPLSKGSVEQYERYVRCYVAPVPLGDADVAAVISGRYTDSQDPPLDTALGWQDQLVDSVLPRSATGQAIEPVTIRNVRTFLTAVFDWACSEDSGDPPLRTAQNPFRRMGGPRVRRGRRGPILYSPQECVMFLRCAFAVDPAWAAMLLVAIATGLRWCELVLLAPAGVDPVRNMLYITEHWGAGEQPEPGRKGGDDGEVAVPEWFMRRILIPRTQTDAALVFTDRRGRRWTESQMRYRFKKLDPLLRAAGLTRHIRPHRLRHTYANWLKGARFHHETVGAAMGHRIRTQTGEYLQLTETDWAEIRARVVELLPESVWPGPPAPAAAPVPHPVLRIAA